MFLGRKKLRIAQVLVVLLFLSSPFEAGAGDLPLPADLNARASVLMSEVSGLWEKSLVVTFPQKRHMLSTNEGLIEGMIAMNHAAHPELFRKVCIEMRTEHEVGGKVYIRRIKERIAHQFGVLPEEIAEMATAVDLDNIAVITKRYPPFIVTALVTAGAKANALRAGLDEGKYIEGEEPKGTVNIILLTNAALTEGAMARTIVTLTEAKTAAFEDLKISSNFTKNAQATGTGTDSVIVVSGIAGPKITYTGGHSKIGELIGKAVYDGVIEALGKQNGFKRQN
jgi:adenosylcobinamide amidohydrolase